jgi:predicted Fe-S protein YdhL (DUF1289 family)
MAHHDLPANPCINVCRMDLNARYCQGCMRTLTEIARWERMGVSQRIDLAAQLQRRRGTQPAQRHDSTNPIS